MLWPEHPEVAATWPPGRSPGWQGKDNEAEQLYERALAILNGLMDRSITSWRRVNNLAAIQHKQGDHAEAERLYKRALAMKENWVPTIRRGDDVEQPGVSSKS